jgi:hypothetical protein
MRGWSSTELLEFIQCPVEIADAGTSKVSLGREGRHERESVKLGCSIGRAQLVGKLPSRLGRACDLGYITQHLAGSKE